MPGKDVAPCQDFSSQFRSGNSVRFKWAHTALFTNFSVSASHSIGVNNEVFWNSSAAPGKSGQGDLWQSQHWS